MSELSAFAGAADTVSYQLQIATTATFDSTVFDAKEIASLAAPILESPGDNAQVPPPTVAFSWGSVEGATSYRFQLSKFSNFSATERDSVVGTTTSFAVAGLAPKTSYYWRVTASGSGGLSSTSLVRTFTTTAVAPGSPVLVGPANQSQNVTLTPVLLWMSVATATSYHVQIALSEGFLTLAMEDTALVDTSWAIGPLSHNTTYFWRVRAKNESGYGPFAEVQSFTTIVAAPQAPVLQSPADQEQNVPLNPTLQWIAAATAVTYHVQVSTAASFATPLLDDSTVTGLSLQIGPLAHNTTYFWRVRAKNESGYGAFTDGRSFTTIMAAPQAPALSSPADQDSNVTLSPTLVWNATTTAVAYHLQVSTDQSFASFVLDDSTLTGLSLQIGPLSLNTTYYWRVRAKNQGGVSPFSETRQFRTILTTTIEAVGDFIPEEFSLSQNYPNPFNPATMIRFDIRSTSTVTLQIYNTLGQVVALLVDDELRAGRYQLEWRPTGLASGVYFYRLQAVSREVDTMEPFVKTRKLILSK